MNKYLKVSHENENKTIRKHWYKNQIRSVKIKNQICMENHERFKNIFLGFSIQASRLNHILLNTDQYQHDQIKQIYDIMKKIQTSVLGMGADKEKYDNYLNNSVYCKIMMRGYAKKLEMIIADTDALLKGDKNQ